MLFSKLYIYIKITLLTFQSIPDTLLGAVLGYAACAPIPKDEGKPYDRYYNKYPVIMNAISISFDGVGFGTTLARTFNRVSQRPCIRPHKVNP